MHVGDLDRIRALIVPNARLSDPGRVHRLLGESRALLDHHFVFQAGDHSRYFLRFGQIGRDARLGDEAAALVQEIASIDLGPDWTILSPESAGFFLGEALARRTGAELVVSRIDERRRPVPAARRGRIRPGRPVVIVNDVVTTGRSLSPLLRMAELHDAPVRAVLAFTALDPVVPLFLADQALSVDVVSFARWERFPAARCPLCEEGRDLLVAFELN